jgi:hypothetical protein
MKREIGFTVDPKTGKHTPIYDSGYGLEWAFIYFIVFTLGGFLLAVWFKLL